MIDVNTRTRGSGSLLDLVTPIAAASALACLTLALATPNWYLHHHHPNHHYPHHHYLLATPNWYLHHPTSIHPSSPPPVGTPPPPWDTKNYHWDHPWEYPIKTYLLKLYHGPTIPPAGPCRPKAGFGLVSVNSCVWRRRKDIKYQGLRMKMRAQFIFSLSKYPESIILVGYFVR